ncbi:MAG TPA: S8 family serine peptidase, partial [Pyrinomonadaceae bacterium]
MRKVLLVCLILSSLLVAPMLPTTEAQRQNQNANFHKHEQAIVGSYIVVFKDEISPAAVDSRAHDLSMRYGGLLTQLYRHALRGFAVQMSEQAAEALAHHPLVSYVEQDTVVELAATQPGAPWGLDRIDQRDQPPSNTYTYANNGAGTRVYVIDSGIRTTHEEFEGRASVGFDNVGDTANGQDCYGHGTQVAGIVGGKTYGVAKGVQLVAVRAFGCTNLSSATKIIGAVDWVTANHQKPAVAVMSASGGANLSIDTAVRNSIGAGVTYALAAGNLNVDAGTRSPSRVSEALTVGATDITDTRATFSNYGAILDLFAPGVDIPTVTISSDTATLLQSGTSMAAAHVAGTAARYLSGNPAETPSEVRAAVVGNATANKVVNPGTGSSNLLLYRPQSKLAYERYKGRSGQLFVMNNDGSGAVQITDGSDDSAQWSPNGSKVVFRSDRDGNSEIYVVNADGSNLVRLTNNSGYEFDPDWSPDSSKISFASDSGGNRDIYVVNADGSNLLRLTTNPSYESNPEWSPDGTKIAFASGRDGNGEIYSMNADGSAQTRLTNNYADEYGPAWSPDGTKIAFTHNGGYEVRVMNANGSNPMNVTNSTSWWSSGSPVWSPDSSKILFTSHKPYADSSGGSVPDEVFVVNANGTNLVRLTNSQAGAQNPAWSPDGTKITFVISGEVYVMNADGSVKTNLTNHPAGEYQPVWSPDGARIAFVSDRNSHGNEISLMNPDGSDKGTITNSYADESSPVWSRDGTRVAYIFAPNGTNEIGSMRPDGSSRTQLTNNSADDYSPSWSPDGSKIAFVSRRDGNDEIYVMNADGSAQTRLT